MIMIVIELFIKIVFLGEKNKQHVIMVTLRLFEFVNDLLLENKNTMIRLNISQTIIAFMLFSLKIICCSCWWVLWANTHPFFFFSFSYVEIWIVVCPMMFLWSVPLCSCGLMQTQKQMSITWVDYQLSYLHLSLSSLF